MFVSITIVRLFWVPCFSIGLKFSTKQWTDTLGRVWVFSLRCSNLSTFLRRYSSWTVRWTTRIWANQITLNWVSAVRIAPPCIWCFSDIFERFTEIGIREGGGPSGGFLCHCIKVFSVGYSAIEERVSLSFLGTHRVRRLEKILKHSSFTFLLCSIKVRWA